MIARRTFLQSAAAMAAGAAILQARRGAKVRIGVTDWNLGMTGKLEAVGMAKALGFEGVQVSCGQKVVDGKLPIDNPDVIAKYRAEAKEKGIGITSTCLDILHVNYLKNDPLGPKWVSDSIRVTKALGTEVILLPFFGKGALKTPEEMDRVGDILKELGPEAEKAKVILGLEDTISAADNLRIMERSKSKAVKVYYDVGNSTHGGFDILREIRQLGRKNICELHLKDNPHYLGEGKIDFPAVMHAIAEIEYQGWAVLETDNPSKSVEADMKRNLTYVRRLMAEANV